MSPDELLDKVVSSFAELRQLSDEGLISYPYSTREAVNIVKHLQVRIPPELRRGGGACVWREWRSWLPGVTDKAWRF